MSFLLDTNVVSEVMKKIPEPGVMSWIRQNHEHCFFSSITLAEIELGIELLPGGQRKERLQDALRQLLPLSEERVLVFDVPVARCWARLCAQLERQGRKTPILDSMIEATALQWNLTVVTRNVGDFAQAATFNPLSSQS